MSFLISNIYVVASLAAFGLCLVLLTRLVRMRERVRRLNEQESSLEVMLEQSQCTAEGARHGLAWYRQLFDQSTDMVFVFRVTPEGLPGPFLDINANACERMRYTRDQLRELTITDVEAAREGGVMPRLSRAELQTMSDEEVDAREDVTGGREFVRQVIHSGGMIAERKYVTRDGESFPVEIRAKALMVDEAQLIVVTAHDITERRRTEQALRESEIRLREFFEHSPIGVALYDGQKQLLRVNLTWLKMFGSPGRDDFAQFNMFDNPFVPAEPRVALDKGESTRFEMQIDFDGVREQALFTTRHEGQAYFDVFINNLGLDSEYQPRGYVAQAQDVTQRRKTEEALQQSEMQLRQAHKMEAIGNLAGGIAHDFNNILTPILGYAEMASMSVPDGSDVQEFVHEIVNASHRAKELVKQILTFSRRAERDAKPVCVMPIVKEVVKHQRALLPSDIEIELITKAAGNVVSADPIQIHQVLMNLCTNAGHAMHDAKGRLEVRLTNFTIAGTSREFPQLGPGRYLRMSVSDTGCGMPPDVAERVFEPFYTTKPSGEGTGMGLSVVHGIVSSYGGAVAVDTAPGRGSSFHVVLPVVENIVREKEEDETLAVSESGRCVLFVEDEPQIRKLAAGMLPALGYKVEVASSAKEALGMFKHAPAKFDVVVTDYVMPEVTGAELAAQLKELRPDLPIVLCTGFAEDLTEEALTAAGIEEMITKPVTMRLLSDTLTRVLE